MDVTDLKDANPSDRKPTESLNGESAYSLSLEERVALVRRAAARRTAVFMERCWIEKDAEGFTGWRWEKYNKPLQIVAAANRYGDMVIVGSRHYCVSMNAQIDLIGLDALRAYAALFDSPEEYGYQQGFIDQYGKFHDRKQALAIALENGQVKKEDLHTGNDLYSEDLW